MAFIVPFIPEIIAGISAGGAVYAANEQRKAAGVQSKELLRQAKSEELSATQQQIERRRNLLRSLGSLNAAAGASGVGLEGSVNALARADIRDASNDLLIDKSNSQQQQASLRAQAGNIRRSGTADFVGAAFGAATQFGQSIPKPKPGTK